MKTINSLVELAQAMEDGKIIEILWAGEYRDFLLSETFTINSLNEICELGHFRIKPEAKIIPLEILIDSGIDCEFSDGIDSKRWLIDLMTEIEGSREHYWYQSSRSSWKNCRPRMNHDMCWSNLKNTSKSAVKTWLDTYFIWTNIAQRQFKITGVKEGYRFAWESDK